MCIEIKKDVIRMDLGLLEMDRLPTLEELKEFFRKNDWTTATIDDPAQRTPEQVAEIEYAKKLMDEKFEPLAREKGRKSAGKYYNKEDNPFCQNTTASWQERIDYEI